MKRGFIATAMITAFFAAFAPTGARANNPGVEAALANYADTSMFYAALLNTGVMGELDPYRHYTIFAPTNQAFAQIQPSLYPCFYAAACRPQVADVLRNHIVVGPRSLNELTKEVEVPTLGRYQIYAESPYVGSYTIANYPVLSGAEINGNMIYRLDGVIITNDQLERFRGRPPLANAVFEKKTVTTYHTPAAYNPTPGGTYPANATETITQKTYYVPGSVNSNMDAYSDGVRSSDTNTTATTVTRTMSARPY